MIQTMIFDIGNVLLFFSHDKMIEQTARLTGLSTDWLREVIIIGDSGIGYDSGKISTEEICEYIEKHSNQKFERNDLLVAMSDIFRPNDTIFPLIKELKNNKIKLLLLSNTSPAHYDYFTEKYDIFQLFDEAILSYQVKALKPDQKIYEAAINRAECRPSECLYIDDILDYVKAARKMGINAEQFTTTESLRSHLIKYKIIENVKL